MNLEITTAEYPCITNALETNGLQKLFEQYPDTAISHLQHGMSFEPKKNPKTLKEALEKGFFPGTVPSKEEPLGWKAVQYNRVRAKNLLIVLGDLPLHKISENDLWWLHVQVYQKIPEWKEECIRVCNITFTEKNLFSRNHNLLSTALLKQLRKMLHSFCAPDEPRILKSFDWKWRSYFDVEIWDQQQHPLHQFLKKNLSKPLFYRYLEGFEQSDTINSSKKKLIQENFETRTDKRLSNFRFRRMKREQRRGEPIPAQPRYPNDLNELSRYPCCLNATTTKGLMKLIRQQPDSWWLWLSMQKKGRHDFQKLTLERAIWEGFFPKTTPEHPVSFPTMSRARSKARMLLDFLPQNRLIGNITEHDLWEWHVRIAVLKQGGELKIKDLDDLRRMIYELQGKIGLNRAQRVSSYFDWDWRRKKGYRLLGHSVLDLWLSQNWSQKYAQPYAKGTHWEK